MLSRHDSSNHTQKNLFYGSLLDMLDSQDPLIALADTIDWQSIEKSLSVHYTHNNGRPAKPIRLMAGLLMLKQLENLSDERVVVEWKRNPYYQYFCGYKDFQTAYPCHATEMVYFRKRIGKKGVEEIFKASVVLHGKRAEEKEVLVDTTVQEKNITYPTDGKLAIKMIHHLQKISKSEGLQLRRTYLKEIKSHRLNLRFFKHPKKIKKAKASIKRLRTIVGILIRDISRNISNEQLKNYQETFDLFDRVRNQQIKDKNKVLSLHENHVYAITKGKEHKKYEYGVKASVVTTKKSGVIVGATCHESNEHDSKTLDSALQSANKTRTTSIKEAICDRGYRGVKEVTITSKNNTTQKDVEYTTKISIPGAPLKRDTEYQKQQKREKFKRRAAIEPVIGHLKSDYRLSRNYLKGFMGDEINLLMACTAFNMKKWMNDYIRLLFALKILYSNSKKTGQTQQFENLFGSFMVTLLSFLTIKP